MTRVTASPDAAVAATVFDPQQQELVPEAVRRADAYLEAGADCVYPIALWETEALREFTAQVNAPINVMRLPQAPSLAELAELGVARVSWATLLYRDAMAQFEAELASLSREHVRVSRLPVAATSD